MFVSLDKAKNFGVFKNYSNTGLASDFSQKNIIYGWNYSGKTTLSRIFSSIEKGVIHSDYSSGSFKILKPNAESITESNLDNSADPIRVFNTDFIEENISWDGSAFSPILLLGKESISAEKEIEKNTHRIESLRIKYREKKHKIQEKESGISELKKQAAKSIKREIRLIEAFNAGHLERTAKNIASPIDSNLLGPEALQAELNKAHTQDTDKLPQLQPISLRTSLAELHEASLKLISKTPEMSEVIEYLKDNPDVSRWVEKGLQIHEDKQACEFCGAKLHQERMNSLLAHFSKDLVNHKERIRLHLSKIEGAMLHNPIPKKEFVYPEFQRSLLEVSRTLESFIGLYNEDLKKLIEALSKKHDNPFSSAPLSALNSELENKIADCIRRANEIIDRSNDRTTNFNNEKVEAIKKLKAHYVAEFLIESNIGKKIDLVSIMKRHLEKYRLLADGLKKKNEQLEASISHAQKGSKELNELIWDFLGREEIAIEVINEGGGERFRITRSGAIAKNLSEGEKTAISFSFFLTKLKEEKDIGKIIVYIDDPISSLDSNHIFQVNSVIKDFFFHKERNENDQWPWKVTCKQLFISTHNFEFFSLLKELPIKQNNTGFYQIRRISNLESTFEDLPKSILKYSSEYHYLFSLIHQFSTKEDKTDLEWLLMIPNAVRRFLELYTYSRMPTETNVTVDVRAETLFGAKSSKRILKVLHYFSHLNNIERLSRNSDFISDISSAVDELLRHVKEDKTHYDALLEAIE